MRIDLDWEIGDEEAPPAVVEGAVSEEDMARPGRPERRRWRAPALAMLTFVIVALAALWLIQEQWRRRLEEELRSTIVLEAQALARGDREIFLKLQDPQDEKWLRTQRELLNRVSQAGISADQVEVVALSVEGDWAWAEVRALRPAEGIFRMGDASNAGEVIPLEQVQFYRRVEGRWVHIAPSPDFLAYWGETATLEAPYLRLEFPERDRPQVEAWLGALAPYAQEVCLDLGCPPEMKLTVVLSPTLSLEESLQMLNPDASRLILPSPHAIGIRQNDPLSEQPVLVAISFSMMALVQSSGGTASVESSGGRSPLWREILARAIFYRELDRAISALTPPEFQAAWAEFKRSLMSPLLRGEWLSLAQFDTLPLQRMVDGRLPEGQVWMLVEYVAQAYGREQIGELLRAAQVSPSLSEAVRARLAVANLDAFERDWRSFVAATLGRAMRDAPLRP